jgi:capsular exopolysaccharide synthesis family protein
LINTYNAKIEKLPEQETRLAELMREKNVYEKMFKVLIDKREELRIAEFSKLQDLIIVDPASWPRAPIAPRKIFNLLLGAILGLVFGFAIAFVQELLDKKVKTISDVENEHPYPILAILPKYSKNIHKKIIEASDTDNRLVTLMGDELVYTEPYRVLRTKLKKYVENDRNVLLFTSCEENTGKTTIVSNFAVSLARAGKKVLVIDCDLRKPKIAKYYNIPKSFPGLINFLSNNKNYPSLYKPFKENLEIIPAGGSVERSSELLGLPKMKNLLESKVYLYDYILLDSPPVTKIIDTLVIGEYARDVILIIRPKHTFKDSIDLALEEFEQLNIEVIGFIFNACEKNQMPTKYKYGYRYGYEYHDKESK